MMADSTAVLPPNGLPLANALNVTAEIQQYNRLLKLRDDIVAGIHPRIKLRTSTVQTGSVPSVIGINGTKPNGTPPANVTPLNPSTNSLPDLSNIPTSNHDIESAGRSKARLERQRVERDLAESNRKEKPEAGQRGFDQDVLPDFDVSEVFFQAQDIVKPLTQHANHHGTQSPSGDEETFYSSGAGTEDSEEQHNSRRITTKPCSFFFEKGTCLKGDRCNFSHDPAFRQQLQKSTSNRAPLPPPPGYTAQGGRIRESPTYNNVEDGEVADEAPYSPSMNIMVEDVPAQTSYPPKQPHRISPNNVSAYDSRTDNRQQGRNTQRGKDTQVVRNHITSPIAPQPSRVSPLAVAKVSRFDKRPEDMRIQRTGSDQQREPRSKKRRREREPIDNARNVAPRTITSPEPYIKPEPISPPPLSAIPAARSYSGMDHHAARYGERPAHEPYLDEYVRDQPRRIVSPQALPPSGHRRVLSGPGPVPEPRRQQDLRRVVSVRNLERPASPEYDNGIRPRTPSQFVLPRENVQAISHRASVAPQRQSYIVDERPITPAVRYTRQVHEPELIPMAPPTGTIVYDEFGNRFLATTVGDRRASVMPEPRYTDTRRQPEPAPQSRASVRPEVRYLDDSSYQSAAPARPRASVHPDPRYYEERVRDPEVLPRASLRPETRYYEEPPRRAEPATLPRASAHPEGRAEPGPRFYDDRTRHENVAMLPRASVRPEARPEPATRYYGDGPRQVQANTLPRASIRPEARAEAVFINPTFEQINLSGRPGDRYDVERPRIMSTFQHRAASPQLQPRVSDYRASVAPSRPVYEVDAGYLPRQDTTRPIDARGIVREAEGYARVAENASRMSVRPVEDAARRPAQYVEREYSQSIAPNDYRYQELRREPLGYAPARVDAYERHERMEPPPLPTSRGAATYGYAPLSREIGGRQREADVYLD